MSSQKSNVYLDVCLLFNRFNVLFVELDRTDVMPKIGFKIVRNEVFILV